MSKLLGLFLIGILAFVPIVTTAAGDGQINIMDVKLTLNERTLQAVFSVENSAQVRKSMVYGIRLQSSDGGNVYESPVGELALEAGKSGIEYADIELPSTIIGLREVFLVSRNSQGRVTALKYAGEVDIKKKVIGTEPQDSSNMYSPTMLENCNLSEDATNIKCSVIGSSNNSVNIKYAIHNGSIYAPVAKEGIFNNIEIIDNEVIIPTAGDLSSGDYTYRLWISNKNLATNIVVNIDNGDIIEEGGVQNNENAQGGIINSSLSKYNYAKIVIIILPILALIALLYIALRRPKTLMLVIIGSGLAMSGIVVAAVTLTDTNGAAHIFDGVSQDSGDEHFLVTLNNSNSKFQTTEEIIFSIVFNDLTSIEDIKPEGGSIDYNLDGGVWQELVSADYPSVFKTETLQAVGDVGTHTLNFRSPDLCGGIFGSSLFNFGIFGTTDCSFSIDFTVVQNEPPTTPTIGGNCILGEPCNVGIVSTDTEDGELCYEAQWPTGLNTNAVCATQGSPVRVSYTFTSCSTIGTTVRAQATDSGNLQSPWGTGSSDIIGSIDCETGSDVIINAQPILIPSSGIVNIRWEITNMDTCSMVSSDIRTGDQIQSWDWNFINSNSNMDSVVLESATKYTMACTDSSSDEKTSSVTVTNVPEWQEF